MNDKFILTLQNYIDFYNKQLENFNKNTPNYIKMNEEQKIEAITRETQISMLKWARDIYLKCTENEEENED